MRMRGAILTVAFVLAGSLIAPQLANGPAHDPIPAPTTFTPISLFFVGDIMLARDVELYLDREGAAYPYLHVTDLLSEYDAVIGNFEAVVSDPHVPTPTFTFQFSVRPQYLKGLSDAGFDILSLANNHSSDHGESAYVLTKQLCVEYALQCAGNARSGETFVHEVRGVRIGFLFVNTTWGTTQREVLQTALRELSLQSDVQIVYVHWGVEYELVHDAAQEALAHALIDAGADAVIGHHPHVVQDVGLYKDRPILYSLGNFIFDQYWNEDVATGLGVEMRIEKDTIIYRMIPFTRADSRNQPQPMADHAASALFARIMKTHPTGTFTGARDVSE